MESRTIRRVLVAGGGIVGWSAAAALKRRLPALSVSVIATPPPSDALADWNPCTLPSIVDFHRDLGLTEADTVIRSGSGYRLGTRFEGWADTDYVHAYGSHGDAIGSVQFYQLWLRAAKSGPAVPFDLYSPAAVMARENRFAPPDALARSGLKSIGYGLHIDRPRYQQMMRAFALHLGATEISGPIENVRLSPGGSIEAAQAGGQDIVADLYVDASGPAALLRSHLADQWEDWSAWLRADRILIARSGSPAEPSLLDRAVAAPGGWWWQASAPGRTHCGFVYSSRLRTDEDAKRELHERTSAVAEKAIEIRQGRWSQPWLRNCVAIGDAAIAIEPLEWTNLHLAHGAIDRLVAMMPDRDFSPVELWDYNRQIGAEADRVRDFLILHYATAAEKSENLPSSLAHTLQQFRERGRLPYYEEETFSRDSWLAVLIGQSVRSRRIDPLTDAVAPADSDKAMTRMRETISTFVDRLPKYPDYLQQISRKAA